MDRWLRCVVLISVVGVVIGGCASFLFRRNKVGLMPMAAAVAAALALSFVGFCSVFYSEVPLKEKKWGVVVFWCAVCGAFIGAAIGVMIRSWHSWADPLERQRRKPDAHEDGADLVSDGGAEAGDGDGSLEKRN
jgi:drug/metabolite transporter (DMT)-like permease